MSTDPHSLKIRIRLSGPASAPAVETPAVTESTSRPALIVAGGVVVALLLGWGLWARLAQHKDEPVSPVIMEAPPLVTPPAADLSSIAPPVESATAVPSPAAHKTPAVTQTRERSKTPTASGSGTNLVVRAVLTDSLRNHRPVKELGREVPASDMTKRLSFFTEVHDVGSRRFTHRWEYRGKPVAQINFKPSGKNWSAASSKQIPTHMQGDWRVVLLDDQGRDLKSVEFVYGANASPAN